MKILFLHRWVGVHEGGTETHIKNLMGFLAAQGHKVTLLTREGRALADFDPHVIVCRVPKVPGESDFSYQSMRDPRLYLYTALFMILVFSKFLQLYLVKRRKFDLISVHFLTEAKVARLIRRLFRIPFVFSLEGYTPAEAREAKKANLAFACSQEIIERCQRDFGYAPVLKEHGVDFRVFNPSIDGAAVREKYELKDSFVFLTVARLEPRKDLKTLLFSAKNLLERYANLRFLIVGEGVQQQELWQLNKQLETEKRVIFAGRVSDQELPCYYAAGDVFVLPSLYEGFGIVYAEAMASGLPVVSTTAGAIPEVVGEAGLLVKPGDAVQLEKALERIYLDKDLFCHLRDKALRRAREHFDTRKYLRIFEKSCLQLWKSPLLSTV